MSKLRNKRVKSLLKKGVNKVKYQRVHNFNLSLVEITTDNEDVVLTLEADSVVKIDRLGYLVSEDNQIYNIPFKQDDNKIILKFEDLSFIQKIGKHVLRVFYEKDAKAHTLQLGSDFTDIKYPLTQGKFDSGYSFLYFYTNSNGNLTLEVTSKTYRKTAAQHIQGYLDGQVQPIKENVALFEANHGKTNSGNMFSLALELASRKSHVIYWVTKNTEEALKKFEFYGVNNVKVIEHLSYEYGAIISTAKLLFSDNTFYPFFSKRSGQKYINTWHGTPLKTLGKDIKGEETTFGNIVKNALQVDNFYFSNKYTAEKYLKSLDLYGVLKSDVYIAASPRNSSFFDKNRSELVKNSEKLAGKKVFVYLPTYRGQSSNASGEGKDAIFNVFNEFIDKLPENYILYYKLHPIDTNSIEISDNETRIRRIPDEFELYDFLNATDGLITDYSSVMFDYAVSNKPVFLYTYDKENYFSERGTYLDIDSLPFPQYQTVDLLINAIAESNLELTVDSQSMNQFKQKYAPFDNVDGAAQIINHILIGDNDADVESYVTYNGKPNVYIMGGSLWANGVTAALKNIVDNIDLEDRNYILFLDSNNFKKGDLGRYNFFDDRIRVYPYKGFAVRSTLEDQLVKRYERGDTLSDSENKILTSAIEREISRIFGHGTADYFIHFSGYEVKFAEFVIFMKNIRTVMYVHNDMFREYETRRNFNKNVIFEAYQKADKVVVVNQELVHKFIENIPGVSNKIVIANNFIGYKNIQATKDDSFGELLLKTSFQYSLASQGQGNPVLALKDRLNNGVENSESRFDKINKLYGKIEGSISGIVRNKYLNVNSDAALKNILVKYYLHNDNYLNEQHNRFIKEFGDNFQVEQLSMELLLPKVINAFREDILPASYAKKQSLFSVLQEHRSEKIDYLLSEFENIYNVFGLRKLELLEELYDPDIKVFVNIARFDRQKRLDRLILAFEEVYQDNPNTRLLIVASHGKEKEAILELVEKSSAKRAIRILGAMDNPYPLLKLSDLFVFTSDYEALGLVVYEALAVGLPVVTTNLATTMKNLTTKQVMPVDFSVDGIVEGMTHFLEGDFPQEPFDFLKYDLNSKNEFEQIFQENK